MKVGARIAALIESGAPTRPELAAKIVELGRARGVALALATVESRLAGFQADDLAAVKYFFDDPVRARFLLEALGVDEEDREAYRLAAAALITPEQRGVRLVIDLSNGPQGDDLSRVVGALSTAVIDRAPPRVVLVATESQRRWLPREALSPERVSLEYVRDAEQAWARVAELAREGAVVLSSRRFPEMSRWIAVEWKHGAEPFRIEPDGAVARLADGRPLDAPCPDGDARRLDGLFEDEGAAPPLPTLDAVELRAVMAALATGAAHPRLPHDLAPDEEARRRAAWAQALGVDAVASPKLWAGLLLAWAARLGAVEPSRGTEALLAGQRARLALGAEGNRALLLGETLHLLNPSDAVRMALGHLEGVVVHEEPRRRSPFAVVAELVGELTWEQLLDDPFLDRSFAALLAEGHSALGLEYARMSLLHHNKLQAFTGPRQADWRDALRGMLAHDPPAAGLRFRTTTGYNGHLPLLPGRRKLGRFIDLDDAELLSLRAIVPFRVTREQPLPGAFGGLRHGSGPRHGSLLPAADELSHPPALTERLFDLHRRRDSSPARPDHDFTALPIDRRVWDEADCQVGALWLALRAAMAGAPGVTLHTGEGLLEMGSGVMARVIATRRAPGFVSDAAEVDLFFETLERFPEKLKDPSDHLLEAVETGSAITGGAVTVMQARVPRTIYLARGAHRVVVTFRATPWSQAFADGGLPLVPRAAPAPASADDGGDRPT